MLDSNKLIYHMDRVQAYLRGERIAPILIDIGATKVCNCKCVYCYGVYQKMDTETVIPGDILIRLFRDAPRAGVRALTLTGDGEPTLNPAVWEACSVGKAEGLDIGMATNGIALTPEKIARLLDSLTWCRFNISAGTSAGYAKIHGVPCFERVLDNVAEMVSQRALRGSATTIGLQMVLVPDCLDEVIPLAYEALSLGVDYFVIKQFSDPGASIPCGGFNHAEFAAKALPVLKVAEALSTERTRIIPKYNLIALANTKPYKHCIDLPFLFQISGNSRCYPCGYLFNNEEYCYGDLKKQTFPEIIQSERYWDVIKTIAALPVEKVCQGCCRHDSTNQFIEKVVNRPPHVNFI
jgi:MoaA/NifB/PqqE/SkfB family radical SAM enzyme